MSLVCKNNLPRLRRGFSLVEVIIAFAVLAIISAGASATILSLQKNSKLQIAHTVALQLTTEALEKVRSQEYHVGVEPFLSPHQDETLHGQESVTHKFIYATEASSDERSPNDGEKVILETQDQKISSREESIELNFSQKIVDEHFPFLTHLEVETKTQRLPGEGHLLTVKTKYEVTGINRPFELEVSTVVNDFTTK